MSNLFYGLGMIGLSSLLGLSRDQASKRADSKTRHLTARFHNLFFEMYRASDPQTKALFAEQIGIELSTMGKDWKKYAKTIKRQNR